MTFWMCVILYTLDSMYNICIVSKAKFDLLDRVLRRIGNIQPCNGGAC